MKNLFSIFFLIFFSNASAQTLQWKNVDSLYGPLPSSVHVFFSEQILDSLPFRAYYVIADLGKKGLRFSADTSLNRRLTPQQFYDKNNKPVVVVNTTFFSFQTNRNLNVVVKDGKLVGYNVHTIAGRGKDTLTYRHPFGSAIGISKKRKADIAWLSTDSSSKKLLASQKAVPFIKDSVAQPSRKYLLKKYSKQEFQQWNMQTAVGGGPVLIQDGRVQISNNEEIKFAGRAINDKHPRTAMGYTADGKLVILVIEGRNPNAAGATLTQEAQILKELGCIEALNLDGGGSSCLLVNGKETIRPSDKVQRAVPAVFMILEN